MKQFNHTSISFIISTTILLIFIIHCPLFIIHSQGQDAEISYVAPPQLVDKPKMVNTILKTNPLIAIWGPIPWTAEYRLVVEFTTSLNQATQIGASYLDRSPILKLQEDSSPEIKLWIIRGYRFQISHKFYVKRKNKYAPRGFYFGPHISYSSAKISTKDLIQYDIFFKITHFNVNILCGIQLIAGDKFVVDVFSGWGYKKNIWIEQTAPQRAVNVDMSDLPGSYTSNLKFTLGINLGIAL